MILDPSPFPLRPSIRVVKFLRVEVITNPPTPATTGATKKLCRPFVSHASLPSFFRGIAFRDNLGRIHVFGYQVVAKIVVCKNVVTRSIR